MNVYILRTFVDIVRWQLEFNFHFVPIPAVHDEIRQYTNEKNVKNTTR